MADVRQSWKIFKKRGMVRKKNSRKRTELGKEEENKNKMGMVVMCVCVGRGGEGSGENDKLEKA